MVAPADAVTDDGGSLMRAQKATVWLLAAVESRGGSCE